MFKDYNFQYSPAIANEIRRGLEERGVKVVDNKPPKVKREQKPRLVVTTYYRFGENPSPDTVVKITRGAWLDTAARNAFFHLLQNDYEAGVVEIVDTDNYDELCSVLIRDVQGNIATVFKRDPKRPKLVLDL